ncbi:MAG TPA: CARDB domain-containing protein, partial [Pirellulaceae bacterium]
GGPTNVAIINQGTISADVSGTGITTTGQSFTNQNIVKAENGGTLSVFNTTNFASGTLTGGVWKAVGSSTLRIDNANITTNSASIILDGAAARVTRDGAGTSAIASMSTIASGGSFLLRNGANSTTAVPLVNQGSLTVGASSTLTTNGNYIQSGTSSLGIEIAGSPASGQFGRLAVSGTATLAGALDVGFVNGFGPVLGQSYTPITYASKSGDFSLINVPLYGPDPALGVNVSATNVTLNALLNPPDLTPILVTIPATANLGDVIQVIYEVRNASGSTASSPWTDSVYLSSDGVLGPEDALLGSVVRSTPVAGLTNYTSTLTAPVPVANPGSYRLIVLADSGHVVPDQARANNTLVSPGTINLAIDSHPLVLGQRVQGTIESAYSVDGWTFAGILNQQVRFD